jgi:hypothetical protein
VILSKTRLKLIGVVDLQNVVQIIDAAAERGAFRGNELASVGSVRDRIDAFVKAVSPEALQIDTGAANDSPDVVAENYEDITPAVMDKPLPAPSKKKVKKTS